MLTTLETISLGKLIEKMRLGEHGSVENACGWCLYIDERGRRMFVIDEEAKGPVSFRQLKRTRSYDLRAKKAPFLFT